MNIILPKSHTKTQALRHLRILKDFINFKIYDKPEVTNLEAQLSEFEKKLRSKPYESYIDDDVVFLKSLDPQFYNSFNSENIKSELESLDKSLEGAKLIHVYIPFEMPEPEILKLGNWIKLNLGEETLFDLIFDQSLIGGCAISVNGIYKDYSLKQKIEENKKQVLETLLSFKH